MSDTATFKRNVETLCCMQCLNRCASKSVTDRNWLQPINFLCN